MYIHSVGQVVNRVISPSSAELSRVTLFVLVRIGRILKREWSGVTKNFRTRRVMHIHRGPRGATTIQSIFFYCLLAFDIIVLLYARARWLFLFMIASRTKNVVQVTTATIFGKFNTLSLCQRYRCWSYSEKWMATCVLLQAYHRLEI